MLKEKSYYKEGLPVNVITANIDEYPIHFHDDIEVVYVLDGSVILKNGYYTYTLVKGDIFILNDREIHSFYHTDEPNMVMMLQMDLSYFSKYYDNLKNCFFVTDMKDEADESLEALRSILARIMIEVLDKGYGYEFKVIESTHNLIASLMSNFQYFAMEDGKFVNEAKNKGNKILAGRLNRITDYMYDNYTRRLTLNEIAEREHLSIYYLSHVIREATGLSFQELLSFIRVEESEKLLLGTNKKVGAISEESGFSAVRYYIKYFTKWFGMHPLEYREKFNGKVSSREILARYKLSNPKDILKAIKHQVKEVYASYQKEEGPVLTIVKLNLDNPFKSLNLEESSLHSLLKHECMKPARYPYKIFVELSEPITAEGDNYLISGINRSGSDKGNISILLYNNNEDMKKLAEKELTTEDILPVLEELNENAEILIKISGMNGEYKISRYKFSKEYFLTNYKIKLGSSSTISKREKLINKWATDPTASFTDVNVVDTLSLQSNLMGFSAELILIDKVNP